jgi:dolichol kinase
MALMKGSERRAALSTEARRKAIHLTGLSVPAALLLFGKAAAIGFVAAALAAAALLERARLSGKLRLPAVRDQEAERVAGYFYYILGALMTVALFSSPIAVAAMLMLALGDAASGIIGSVVRGSAVRTRMMEGGGRRTKPMPVVAGTFAVCLLVGNAASLLEGIYFVGPGVLTLPVRTVGAAAATFADAIPLTFRGKIIDDNLSIPLFSGSAMSLAALL